MDTVLVIGFILFFLYVLIQFARQEHIQDDYEEAILDIEGRLDWARSRSTHPFGMRAQMEVCCDLLDTAKSLWKANKWQQAYHVCLQSQEAMNRAQSIYSSAIRARREG